MGISLTKGQKIDLTKSTGESLTNFCVGVNWGAIIVEKKSFFGTKREVQDVDLDLSCILTDASGGLVDYIYSPDYNGFLQKNNLPLGKLTTGEGALRHSGDDRKGDVDGDDGLDNEIIAVDLSKVNSKVDKIFFFLNIYLNQGQNFDFSNVPYAKIRMYEGTPKKVNTVFASYDIATNQSFAGKGALILGKLYRRGSAWRLMPLEIPLAINYSCIRSLIFYPITLNRHNSIDETSARIYPDRDGWRNERPAN